MDRRRRCLYRNFRREESAQDVVEYALLILLISAGMILAWNWILSASISTVLLTVAKQFIALW